MIDARDLEKFSYSYPSLNDTDQHSKITKKKEFLELAVNGNTLSIPAKGEYYPYQELIRRYMTIYNFLIVDWEPGVGKTGAAFAVGETFRKSKNYDYVTSYKKGVPNWIKTMYFLGHNEDIIKKHAESFSLYSNLKDIPSDFYTLSTHVKFYGEYSTKSDAENMNTFSESIFVIDEAHIILTRSDKTKDPEGIYMFFKHLFSITPNIKVMLLSGTTIIEKSV